LHSIHQHILVKVEIIADHIGSRQTAVGNKKTGDEEMKTGKIRPAFQVWDFQHDYAIGVFILHNPDYRVADCCERRTGAAQQNAGQALGLAGGLPINPTRRPSPVRRYKNLVWLAFTALAAILCGLERLDFHQLADYHASRTAFAIGT
jgi:hypothetical protein